jgi:hypothetical protein
MSPTSVSQTALIRNRGTTGSRSRSDVPRVFLLSPASVAGARAALLLRGSSQSEISHRLRARGVPLGELFSFMSSLYFRGKLAYATAFSNAPPGVHGAFVITPSGGLVPPDTVVTLDRLREITAGDLDPGDARYRAPLHRDARLLADRICASCQIILLGSVATPKYVDPLLSVFGAQLMFPAEFVGRGDMSRGGLMLRCVEAGEQLPCIPVLGAVRHGQKPPKLKPLAGKTHSSDATSLGAFLEAGRNGVVEHRSPAEVENSGQGQITGLNSSPARKRKSQMPLTLSSPSPSKCQ